MGSPKVTPTVRQLGPLLTLLLAALVSVGARNALAVPVMVLAQDTVLITVADNGALDADPTVGSVSYTGQVGDYFGSFAGTASPFTSGAAAPLNQPFMTFSGAYAQMANTSPYAAIVWFIETGFGAMDASRSTLFKFPTFGVGSSSWYLNPPNQLTIGTPLLNMSGVSDVGWLSSTTPFSLMNVIHLGTSSSPMNFSSSAEFALVPDSASSLALLGPLVLGLIILPKRWRSPVVNRP